MLDQIMDFFLLLAFPGFSVEINHLQYQQEISLFPPKARKDMILLTDRPPNLETPLKYFLQDYTPNDVFFCSMAFTGTTQSYQRGYFPACAFMERLTNRWLFR
jgi:hypothetical protein